MMMMVMMTMMVMMVMMVIMMMMMIAMKSYWYIIRYMDCRLGHWEMKSSWSAPSIPDLVVASCCS